MSLFWAEARALLLLTGIFYLGALLFVSIRSAGKKDDLGLIVGMPIAVSIMHFCWGGGFLFHAARRFVSAGSATLTCEPFSIRQYPKICFMKIGRAHV